MNYIKRGSSITVSSTSDMQVFDHLPLGTYAINSDPFGSLYLEEAPAMELPPRIYGNTQRYATRIGDTFRNKPGNCGVLLLGEKGSGKSLLAKLITNQQNHLPTIMINRGFNGETLSKFIQSIDQPAIVMIDEFDKIFDSDAQESLLSLFDGVYVTKKLFILTANNRYRINDLFINRPGRVHYMIKYEGLEESFIEEYCNENLKDKTQIPAVIKLSRAVRGMNFDILKAVINEMNMYDETVARAVEILNVSIVPVARSQRYSGSIHLEDGSEIALDGVVYIDDSPFSESIELSQFINDPHEVDEVDEDEYGIATSVATPVAATPKNGRQKKTPKTVSDIASIEMIEFLMDLTLDPANIVNYKVMTGQYIYKVEPNDFSVKFVTLKSTQKQPGRFDTSYLL